MQALELCKARTRSADGPAVPLQPLDGPRPLVEVVAPEGGKGKGNNKETYVVVRLPALVEVVAPSLGEGKDQLGIAWFKYLGQARRAAAALATAGNPKQLHTHSPVAGALPRGGAAPSSPAALQAERP